MDELTAFLKQQKHLVIAPRADAPWIANVFMGCEHPQKIYFIGNEQTQYGQSLMKDSSLAFATAWFNDADHTDRKGIQGVGACVPAEDPEDIETGVRLHNAHYPEFADRITVSWVQNNGKGSHVWVIAPMYIKFWNDAAYGQDGTEEFRFA